MDGLRFEEESSVEVLSAALGHAIGACHVQKSNLYPSPGWLPRLEVMHLVDETLEFGDGVAALVGSHALVDGQGHGFSILAHVADRALIGLGSGLIVVHEHGAEFSGDLLGSPGLMEEGQELLPALLLVGDPYRLHVGEREAPLADLRLLFFG